MDMKISPSMLACDFANMGAEANKCAAGGAHLLHLDVMDGHFVPNISFGAPVLRCLRKVTDGFLDVHLMISQPENYVDDFLKAGADLVNFHVESQGDLFSLIQKVKAAGRKVALTIKPATPAEALFPYLPQLDMVLVMSVEPGFGGQKFMPEALDKVRLLRQEIDNRGLACEIEIDGGINLENAPLAYQAGVDILVAGSSVYGAEDPKTRIGEFKKACEGLR